MLFLDFRLHQELCLYGSLSTSGLDARCILFAFQPGVAKLNHDYKGLTNLKTTALTVPTGSVVDSRKAGFKFETFIHSLRNEISGSRAAMTNGAKQA